MAKNIENLWNEFERMGLKSKLTSVEENISSYLNKGHNVGHEELVSCVLSALAFSKRAPGIGVVNSLVLKRELGLSEDFEGVFGDLIQYAKFSFDYNGKVLYAWFDSEELCSVFFEEQQLLTEGLTGNYQHIVDEYQLKAIFNQEEAYQDVRSLLMRETSRIKDEITENEAFKRFNQNLKDIIFKEYDERMNFESLKTH